MKPHLSADADIAALMEALTADYARRGVNIVRAAGGWMLRTAPDLARVVAGPVPEARKLSRAAIEVLAIVAYHQPVTRAEIEEIRGVSTSRARWTCCWRPDGCACAAAARRRAGP